MTQQQTLPALLRLHPGLLCVLERLGACPFYARLLHRMWVALLEVIAANDSSLLTDFLLSSR